MGTAGEPPGPEPGSLDIAALVQLLLGGEAPPGDQTVEQPGSQPDRLAGAGTNQTEDAGELADGEMLVALMAQLAAPVAEPEMAPPLVALSVAGATAQQTAARTTSTPTGIEVLSVPADEAAGSATLVKSTTDAPPVLPPPAVADAATTEVASAAVPDVERQQALPLTPASAGSGTTTEPAAATRQAPIVEEPAAVDLETTTVDAAADEAILERTAPEPARAEVPVTVARESVTPANVDADAALPPVNQPVTSSARSSTPVSATDPVATPPSNEVFTAELASTVRRASMLGDQEVRLLLNPPELGHLDVRVVESPQGLRIVLEATSAEARELIEQQLPALRTALEARDLKVERLQVDQALDASALDEQSERGLRQDGQGENGSDQSGQDSTPWSPVASMQSDGTSDLASAGVASGSESNTQSAAGDGRLDVLA